MQASIDSSLWPWMTHLSGVVEWCEEAIWCKMGFIRLREPVAIFSSMLAKEMKLGVTRLAHGVSIDVSGRRRHSSL